MGELSKTARASMVQSPKEKKTEETPEQAIKAIRNNLVAGLWVGDNSRVVKLLDAYDKFREDLIYSVVVEEVKKLESGHSIKITKVHDEISIEPADAIIEQMIEPTITDIEARQGCGVVTAEIPAQEEDPHHMVDFGHDTVHTEAAGA
jgi:hypothetical protein